MAVSVMRLKRSKRISVAIKTIVYRNLCSTNRSKKSVYFNSAAINTVVYRNLYNTNRFDKIVQFNLSDIGEGIRQVTLKDWFVKIDDEVQQFDDICEVESDKAVVNITSRYDGKVKKLYHSVGDTAFVGKPLVDIEIDEDSNTEAGTSENVEQSKNEEKYKTEQNSKSEEKPKDSVTETAFDAVYLNKSLATPAVRRIAMENNINLSDIKGTGKDGRIMKEDILNYLSAKSDKKPEIIVSDKKQNIVPLNSIQKVMFKTMTSSQNIPTFLFAEEVDMTALVKVRKEVKQFAENKGVTLTYLPFFIKAFSKALFEFPIINSSLDEKYENVIYKDYHNIGLAVDTPAGLVVPNVKHVEALTIVQIARELNRLQELASKGKLTPSDLTGGTFSVSNIGSIGGTNASPMILPPEVCIVAVCQTKKVPRFDAQNNVVPAHILNVSASADHRILDGATVARFITLWKTYIENPGLLMLDL